MSGEHKTFRCRKCGKRGDVKWLATHGHNRVSAFVLGLLGRMLGR